jgi:sorting nexin-9/18/33
MSKLKENEKLAADGKITAAETEAVRSRVDTINHAMLAEINHFHAERVADFKEIMVNYLKNQVDFYQRIATELSTALVDFEHSA